MSEVLFQDSTDPVKTDHRDIDQNLALLLGESARQAPPVNSRAGHSQPALWQKVPEVSADNPTYYDRPLLKEPVWKIYVPAYYFIGGAAGAALALGAAAQTRGSEDLSDLVRRAHWVGIIGSSMGGVLLILDLGRPSRFLNMLRVFRPTSPMSVGAWILAITAPAAITAGLFARSHTWLRGVGEAAGYISGVMGLALATYTGVLVAGSAIPVWQESRRTLPLLFGASAVASAGAILDLFDQNERSAAVTRTYTLVGRIAELSAAWVMEAEASRVPRVAKPLREGPSGILWRSAAAFTGASLLISLLPRQTRFRRALSGALALLGSASLRFAVHQAGTQSARDPRAAFHLQRVPRD